MNSNIYSILSLGSKLNEPPTIIKSAPATKKRGKKEVPTKAKNDTVVLIDLSNFIFQRFYAVNTWANMSDNEFSCDEECIKMYERMFEKHLLNIKKKCKCEWENMYLATDCSRDSIWRMKHCSTYKGNRGVKLKHDLIPKIFYTTYNELIPRLQETFDFKILKCAEAEGDDIIGVVKHYMRKQFPTRIIVIISNDSDYIQLIDNYTSVYNQSFKNLIDRIPIELRCADLKVLGDNYLQYKILKGDVSDNISPVFPKMNSKNIIKMIFDESMLSEKLHELKCIDNYDLNKLIIDLKMTPDYIKQNIIENLKSI